MVAAIQASVDASSPDPSTQLIAAQRRLMVRRLPLFAACWLATTALWSFVLIVEARVTPAIAALGFLVQASILGAAFTVCRADPVARRVPRVVTGACALVGVSWTAVFAAVGGDGDMLAFIHLMLYVSSSLSFAWDCRRRSASLAAPAYPGPSALRLLT